MLDRWQNISVRWKSVLGGGGMGSRGIRVKYHTYLCLKSESTIAMVEHQQPLSSNINQNYSFSTRGSNHVRSIQGTGLPVRFRSHSRPASPISQKFLRKPSAVCSCSTARSQCCRPDAATKPVSLFWTGNLSQCRTGVTKDQCRRRCVEVVEAMPPRENDAEGTTRFASRKCDSEDKSGSP